MAKVMSSGKGHPQLPPTDRELALRAQIKTGWSSYRKSSSLSQRQNLSEQEVKIIQDVVERAQALERMEEIRIGLLMLKHKQMVDNCRGDGVTSCRICNRDFTSQRSSRPEPIQYCQDCQMVMCGRCKNVCKMVGGQDRMLCTVCYDERELWKKSGAWLDHSVPSVSIPEEELEELQQQQVKTTKVTIGRKRESTLVIDPYQCAEESDDDEDDNDPLNSSTASKSGIQFSRSSEPSPITNRRASPIPEFTAPKAKQLEAAFSAGHKSSSDSEDQRNFSANLKTRSFSRKANLSRKGGITGVNRDRLLKYRERTRSNSPHSRSTSPSSNTEMGVADRDVPSIKVSAIPSRSLASSQANRNSTPDSENDSPQKRHIRQMQSAPYTESGSIQVSTRGEPFTVNKDNPPAANRSPIAGRSPSPQPGRTKPETSGETKAFIEELKKVKSPPQKPPPLNESKPAHDEFKKVKMSGSLPRNSLPTLKNEDEFRKVKSIAPPPQNPPPVNESKPAHDEFKKVKTASLPRHSLPMDKKSEDEFKKVKSTAPAPQKPPPVMDASVKPSEDEFKKVKSGPSPSKPPPVLDASKVVDEDFKKVKSSSLERTRKSPEKVPRTRTLPRDGGLGAVKEGENVGGEFKKVNPRSSPFKAGGSDEKPVPQPAHSSPPRVPAKLGSGKATGEEEMFKKVSLPNNEPKPFLPNKRKVLPDLPSSGPPPVVPRGAVPPTAPPRETPTVPTSTPPPHVPRQMKPLPPSGGPPPPLPEKPSSSSSNTISAGSKLGGDFPMLVDAGKQSSITSVGSSVMSEHSATYDVDSGMASPSSLGSTDSVDTGKQAFSFDKQRPAKETSSSEAAAGATGADDVHSRSLDRSSLSRRNAGRLNKRPPPRPRLDEEEAEGRSSSSQSQEQGSEMGPVVTRPRARSRVIRKRPQGMAGGTEDSNAPSDSSHATLEEEGSTQAEFPQRRTRTRSSAVTSADRFQARTASSRTESGEHGNVRPDGSFGSIRMTLQYAEAATTLAVTIHGCKGLRAMDSNGKSDPYVNLFLQPGSRRQRFQTKVIPKNLNPDFDETFSFTEMNAEAMEKKKLCAVVMDYDDFSKDDLIGATQVNLYEVLKSSAREICIIRLLDDRSVPRSDAIVVDRGSIHLSLKYSSAKKSLVVTILAASNVAGHLPKGECECLVKCYWTTRIQCIKGKTQVARKSNSPEFNESIFFPSSVRELIYSSLTVSVWEHKSFKDRVLGEVQFKNSTFWKTFSDNPTHQVQDWYPLEQAVLSPSHKYATKAPSVQ